MVKLFKKFLFWLYLKFHSIAIQISFALYNTEQDILKVDPNGIREQDKKIQRKLHRNQTLEKFYAGKRDEKYVQDFYEVLKKADKFIKTATPHKIAVAADKHGSNFGLKDRYGRRYEHYGWFDDKHKHTGKTLGEVLELELEERRTKDDNYKLLYIFNNEPVEVGLSKIFDVVEEVKTDEEVPVMELQLIDNNLVPVMTEEKETLTRIEYEAKDVQQKSKTFEFPIRVQRDDENTINKIEHLTEYLHVKEIGLDMVLLEFFIPLKFNTEKVEENSEIYKEIINFNSIFVKNEYGEWFGFGVKEFKKRITFNDTHEVWKFEGFIMKDLGTY